MFDEALKFLKSELEGGDEASVELLDDLLVEEVSGSFAFSGGDDASGEGLWGELPLRGRGDSPMYVLSLL